MVSSTIFPPLLYNGLLHYERCCYNTEMHEWALAEAVVESVKKELEGHVVVSVDTVELSLGELQNIEEDILREGLNTFLPSDIPLAEENIVFIKEPAGFSCGSCGSSWSLEEGGLKEDERESIHFLPEAAYSYISCPRCGSADFTITKGRGISIKKIEFREQE